MEKGGDEESACQCRRHVFSPWVGKITWGRKWQFTPVFLPGTSHGQRSLVDYSPWFHGELDPMKHMSTAKGELTFRWQEGEEDKNPLASPTLPAFPLVTLTVSAIQLPDSSPNTVDCFQTPDLCKMEWSLPYAAFLPLWKSSSYSPSQTWFQGHSLLSHPQHLPAQCTGLWWYHISVSMTIHLRVYCTHLVLCVSHRLNGHEFEQAPGVGDRQGSLGCCSPWGLKESDTTEWLKWTDLIWCVSLEFSLKAGLGPGRRWLGWDNVLSNCWTELEWGDPRNNLCIMGPKLLTSLVAHTEYPFCINCWRLCQGL